MRPGFLQFGLVSIVIGVIAGGLFVGAQFFVRWGGMIACGDNGSFSTMDYGFPTAALKIHESTFRENASAPIKHSKSMEVNTPRLIINAVALIGFMLLTCFGAERAVQAWRRRYPVTGTDPSGAQSPRRPSFPRAYP